MDDAWFEEWLARRYPDDEVTRFGKFFFQADVAHVVMLHSAAMKADFCVNGRECFNPWSFSSHPTRKRR